MRRQAARFESRLLSGVVKRTPVKTGRMRRGWVVKIERNQGGGVQIVVGNPVPYAPFVHYAGRPEENVAETIQNFIEDEFKQINKKISKKILTINEED